MKNISSWSIKNPIPIILLFTLLTIAGLLSFNNMRINNNPDIDFPLVAVTAVRPGAAPSEMEVQVTRLEREGLARTQPGELLFRSAGNERQDLMAIRQLHPKRSVGQSLDHYTFNLEGTFSGHVKTSGSPSVMSTGCSKWADNEPS